MDLVYGFMSGDMAALNAIWVLMLPIAVVVALIKTVKSKSAERRRRNQRLDAMLLDAERKRHKS